MTLYDKFLAGDPMTTQLFLHSSKKWARRFFTDPVQIESVVQAAMVEMMDKLRAGKAPAPEQTLYWIYACTNNAVRRELRRVHGHKAVTYESHLHGRAPVDMSQTLRLRQEIEHVQKSLAESEYEAREILKARMRGLAYREISKIFELSEGAARDSVARLRKRLAGELTTRDKVEYLLRQAKRFGLTRHPSTPPSVSAESEARR